MSKLREDLSIGILGAAAGLFSFSIILLVARIEAYYRYLEDTYEAYHRVEGLDWIPISVWHIILSVVASLLVHRYLKTDLRSPFLLWQVVGVSSLFGWTLTAFLILGMSCVMEGDLSSLEYALNPNKALLIAKYVATVFACNVFYGSVISASSRQYVEKFDSEVVG